MSENIESDDRRHSKANVLRKRRHSKANVLRKTEKVASEKSNNSKSK
jgi:hypothetical protein